jgi:hypothetical protein
VGRGGGGGGHGLTPASAAPQRSCSCLRVECMACVAAHRPGTHAASSAGHWGADCALSFDSGGRAQLLAGTGYRPVVARPLVYVYELPPRFNVWWVWQLAASSWAWWHHQVASWCVPQRSSRAGSLWATAGGMQDAASISSTWPHRRPFPLQLDRPHYFLIWQRLLSSGYRTADPAEADFFYVPVSGRQLCGYDRKVRHSHQPGPDMLAACLGATCITGGRPELVASQSRFWPPASGNTSARTIRRVCRLSAALHDPGGLHQQHLATLAGQ